MTLPLHSFEPCGNGSPGRLVTAWLSVKESPVNGTSSTVFRSVSRERARAGC